MNVMIYSHVVMLRNATNACSVTAETVQINCMGSQIMARNE